MSDKASGNEDPSPESPEKGNDPKTEKPIGEEVSVDPQAGDLLDPVDRWWSDSSEEEEDGESPKNRKLDPEEMARIAEKAKQREEEAARSNAAVAASTEDVKEKESDSHEAAVENKDDLPKEDPAPAAVENSVSYATEEPPIEQEEADTKTEDDDVEEIGPEVVLEGDRPPEPLNPEPELEGSGESPAEEQENEVSIAAPVVAPEAAPRESESTGGNVSEKVEEIESSNPVDSPEPELVEDLSDEDDAEDSEEEREIETPQSDLAISQESDSEEEVSSAEESDEVEAPKEDSGSDKSSQVAAVPVEADTVDSGKKKRKGGCWSVFTTLYFFASLIVLVAVLGLGFYGWTNLAELEKKVTGAVDSQLAKRGLYVDYEGWRYQFPRGIVIEGIKLFETPQKEQVVLTASDLGINVDFLKLLKNRTSLAAAEITFDDSAVNFFHSGEQVGSVEEIDAEIFVTGEMVKLQRFEGRMGGLILQAVGEVDMSTRTEAGETDTPESTGEEEATQPALDFSEMKKFSSYLDIVSEKDAPVLKVDFFIPLEQLENLELAGSLSGKSFEWMGISIRSVLSSFEFDSVEKVIHFPAFQLAYGEGLVSGDFSFDTNSQVLTVREAQSSVDLVRLLSDYSDDMAAKLKGIELVDSPLIRLKGLIPIEEPANAKVQLSYNHRKGLKILSEEKELLIRNMGGDFTYQEGGLQTDNFTASLFGGMLRMNGIVRLTKDPIPFRGLIKFSEMSLARIGEYFGGDDLGLSGDVYLEFNGSGYTELKEIKGGGTLRIDNAKLRSFPVVGRVQEFLGEIVPAFGIEENGSVRGAYTFESGALITNDLTVIQAGAKLRTNAMVRMESKFVDFTSTATLQETLAKATGLEGKEIVVTGEGPLGDLSMSVSGFPIDFATEKLSDVLGTSPETLSNLREAIGDPEDAIKILGEQLEGELSEEGGGDLGEEVGGLLRSLLGTEEEEDEEVVRERAIPVEGNE